MLPENKSQKRSQIDGDKVHAGITFGENELQPTTKCRHTKIYALSEHSNRMILLACNDPAVFLLKQGIIRPLLSPYLFRGE